MQARFEQIQQSSGQEYQQLQSLLFAPVLKKANEAIQKIGKEQGFTYIFDVSSGTLPFINVDQSVDVMPIAKKELGIPADKKLPTQQQQ